MATAQNRKYKLERKKYRAAKAGHISAKGIGGGWFGEFAGLEPPTIGWFAPQKAGQQKLDTKCKGLLGG